MKAQTISIGDVEIPLEDFVVARTGILGITRSGKTYGAKGIAEQLLTQKVPIVVFDAIGVWRHLKTPAGGAAGHGFPVVIAGGATPDLPLTSDSAPAIVRAAIKENIPLVIDLYDRKLSKADWRRIVRKCFETLLYENVGRRHIFLEEAAEYVPQKLGSGSDAETYAAVEKLARMGGNHSLGLTIINQRSQEVNKAVLELCDNLVLMRQRGSNAIDSLQKWMDRADPQTAREIAKALPHMTQGECWVWTEANERPIRTKTVPLRSFHPDRREAHQEKPRQASVDTQQFVARLQGEIHDLVEKQKADDPRELKKRIATLERELAQTKKAAPAPAEPVKVSVLEVDDLVRLEKLIGRYEGAADKLASGVIERLRGSIETLNGDAAGLRQAAAELRAAMIKATRDADHAPCIGRHAPALSNRRDAVAPAPPQRQAAAAAGTGQMQRGKFREMLIALAQAGKPLSDRQIAARAGMALSGTFDKYLGMQRTNGWLVGPRTALEVTSAGIAALGDWEPLPTGKALRAYWLDYVSSGKQRQMLAVLFDAWPQSLPAEEVAQRADMALSGTFDKYLGQLRTLLLVEGPRTALRASEELYG